MPVDASIYGLIQQPKERNPLADMAQAMQVQHAMGANALNDYSLRKAQRQDQETNAIAALLKTPGFKLDTPEGQAQAYSVAPTVAPTYIKSQQEAAKARADMGKTEAETGKLKTEAQNQRVLGYRDQLANVNDPQQAAQWISSLHNDPALQGSAITALPLQQKLATIPQDPAQFNTWKQQMALGAVKFTELNKPSYHQQDAGGVINLVATPGLGGAPTVVSTVQKTVSPDARLSAETQRRGQDMVDQRSREATSAALTKPFEITGPDGKPVLVQQDKQGNIRPVEGYGPKQGASKPLTDTQAKALQFGSRMQAAEDIFGDLEKAGTTTSVPGSRAGYGVGAVVSALQPAENQRLDQAKRDFINAVLRRESGAAISPSEFDSAEKQYFPQPGDDPTVRAQKKQNRLLATRGILAEVPDSENRVASVRSGGVKPTVAATSSVPAPGTVEDGHRFKGGNPADPKNWEKV